MKKAGLLILIFVLMSVLVIAQDSDNDGIPDEIQGITNASEKIVDVSQNINNESYLEQEWQKILLRNVFIEKVDSFFKDITIFFKVVFGIDYSLSLTFALAVILWIFIALSAASWTKEGMGLEKWVSYVIGVLFAIALSQLKVIPRIASFSIKLVFSQEASSARWILFVVLIGIIIFLFYLKSTLATYLKAMNKRKAEEETNMRQEKLEKLTKGAGLE
jgi:hypothetical protein